MYSYLPHTNKIRQEMLDSIGVKNIKELFKQIPESIMLKDDISIPEGISELELQRKILELSNKNTSVKKAVSFLGGGIYNRFIPSCIKTITSRSEFATSYTPYQPEVSQGTLQVIYEYQTMICNLTGMDVANASVYDGATACAEAILMASRITNKTQVLVPTNINPEYISVIETYCYGCDIEITYLPFKDGKIDIKRLKGIDELNEYACLLIQNPNYFGSIEDVFELNTICRENNIKLIACVDPISLAILKSPADYWADIAVGDIQSLGLDMSFGGPHGGFISCKAEHLRQLPGRIAGKTKDKDGNTAFTLTFQTREQHIRRAKATSNICSNQALMALAASVYLSVMGPEGIKEAADISCARAHYLADKINKLEGFSILSPNFLNEFVVKVDEKLKLSDLITEMESKNIFIGIDLGKKFDAYKNCLLISVTEMNSLDDIHLLLKNLNEASLKYNL